MGLGGAKREVVRELTFSVNWMPNWLLHFHRFTSSLTIIIIFLNEDVEALGSSVISQGSHRDTGSGQCSHPAPSCHETSVRRPCHSKLGLGTCSTGIARPGAPGN